MDSLGTFVENLLRQIAGLENDIVGIVDLILRLPFLMDEGDQLNQLSEVILQVYNILLPIGLTLLSFFFLIGFFNKTMMFELVNWENILKCIFRLIVAQVIMVNCLSILVLLSSIVAGVIVDVFGIFESTEALEALIDIDAVIAEFNGMDFISKVFYSIQYIIVWAIMLIIRLTIYAIVVGRFIELCMYTFLAPIPIATMVSDEFSSISFRFFQSYLAVCLQGLVILIACITYLAVARAWIAPADDATADVSIVAYLLSALSLLFVLFRSGGWAKAIVGL